MKIFLTVFSVALFGVACSSPTAVEDEDPCELIDVRWTYTPGRYIETYLCEAPNDWPQPEKPGQGGRP